MLKITNGPLSLEGFLRLPEFKPALEFLGGRMIQKMSPKLPHSVIQGELLLALNAFARPRQLGRAYVELRAVFGNAVQVPDLSFYVAGRVPKFTTGAEESDVLIPADIVVEILSPDQTIAELRLKIRHSLKHGSRLGWLIHQAKEQIHVIRLGQKAERLHVGNVLSGEEVLPGFSLTLEEIFGWLDDD